jgi:tetratricopeptide (TPR) repeat protein
MNHQLSSSSNLLLVKRYVLCGVILILSAAAFYALLPRLISQILYTQAKSDLRKGYYALAVTEFEKAHRYQPKDPEILKQLGEAYYKLGEGSSSANALFRQARNAKEAYLKAASLNPLDVEIAYYLARTEFRLERIYEYLYPKAKQTPYDALPYFKETLNLRPNGILYHYALAHYLHHHNHTDELLQVVQSLCRIYPPESEFLRREPFWSHNVKEAAEKGLRQAINERISLKSAHRALSSLLAEDGAWDGAIAHYKEALRHKQFDNTPADYIHLGRLYLKNGQLREAETSFFLSFDGSQSMDKGLERLYHVYKNEGLVDELCQFYETVSQRFALSPQIDILIARCLIDQRRYSKAQRVLTELNQSGPYAEAYFWLARIADIEKDWDRMELAIQKATVLDPNNKHYRQIFYGLLKRLGKIESAEKEISRAIESSESPSPRFFNERARIRWNRKDYQGAIQDWEKAIQLDPGKASFYAQAGEAYIKLGDWRQALKYYQSAVKLEPKNRRYADRYLELKGESS